MRQGGGGGRLSNFVSRELKTEQSFFSQTSYFFRKTICLDVFFIFRLGHDSSRIQDSWTLQWNPLLSPKEEVLKELSEVSLLLECSPLPCIIVSKLQPSLRSVTLIWWEYFFYADFWGPFLKLIFWSRFLMGSFFVKPIVPGLSPTFVWMKPFFTKRRRFQNLFRYVLHK